MFHQQRIYNLEKNIYLGFLYPSNQVFVSTRQFVPIICQQSDPNIVDLCHLGSEFWIFFPEENQFQMFYKCCFFRF